MGGQRCCSDLIVLLTAQTKGQLELDVILRAAGRGLGRESVRGRGRGQARREGNRQRREVRQRHTYKATVPKPVRGR